MYPSETKAPTEISIISGQAYKAEFGDYRQILIQKVDNNEVYDIRFSRARYIVQVEPGEHEITLVAMLGSALSSLQAVSKYSITVEQGKSYQINYHLSYSGSKNMIGYYYCETGDISSYDEYFIKNKNIERGSPVPCAKGSEKMWLKPITSST